MTTLTESLIEVAQRKTNEMFEEWLAVVRAAGPADPDAQLVAVDDRDLVDRPSGYDQPWSFETIQLPDNKWVKVSETHGETYTWPDTSVDTYDPFVTYVGGAGWLSRVTLGLGYKENGEVIGFVVGSGGGSKRGLTVFWNADDIGTSNEKLSMIRGGGATGRAGFGENDPLPGAYDGIKVEMLRDRVAGKWNVKAVVADAHDHTTMLNHTALQAKLRGLI